MSGEQCGSDSTPTSSKRYCVDLLGQRIVFGRRRNLLDGYCVDAAIARNVSMNAWTLALSVCATIEVVMVIGGAVILRNATASPR